MRPLKLTLEGFTSFRERATLDFGELDLFAITGPTGAGKSSIVDALVFALYGQVPRVSKEYRQLLSHGAERMSVQLDFLAGGASYRVTRTLRQGGGSQVRLERLGDGGSEPLADRVREIEAEVGRVLGLDYDAFTRSVVLPQGQFDAFLKGKPEERRKILVALLGLGVYEQMHAIVNRRAAESRRRSEFIAGQLGVDYQGATPGDLAERRAALRAAEEEAASLAAAQQAVEEGLARARELRAARRDLASLERENERDRDELASVERTLAECAERRRALEATLAGLVPRAGGTAFDERRLETLLGVRPRAEQLALAAPRLSALEQELAARQKGLDDARAALGAAAGRLPAMESASAAAEQALGAARAERESLRRTHAAHDLRQHLRPGQPCPVCEQTVRQVPKGGAPALDSAETEVADAEKACEKARLDLGQERIAIESCRGEQQRREAELRGAETRHRESVDAVRGIKDALAAAGLAPLELADPQDLVNRVVAEIGDLEAARARRDALARRREKAEEERRRLEGDEAAARGRAEAARGRIVEHEAARAKRAGEVARMREVLTERARREEWEELAALPAGRDEVDALDARRLAAQRRASELAGRVAGLRTECDGLARRVERARELGEQKRALDAEAALATALAQHLRADQFIAYVQEEALRRLAEDGSRHLETLSQGRYRLVCEAQEFAVVDRWNADMQRSVRTLSGGESFLASLALALALAESLAALSSEGRAGQALESLFLDEGFGTLDPETLDTVVQAIEALHGGSRMVGVVTHIPELAERMPARIQVSRQGSSAVVSLA